MKIVGNTTRYVRVPTGFWSFDYALGNRDGDTGFPLGTTVELSGATGCGKSTTVFGLANLISQHTKTNVALADLEGFDQPFLERIFRDNDGTLHYLQSSTDEQLLDELVSTMFEKKNKVGVGILDSIGAISPIAEVKGELGEANMGRRAKLLAQFHRKYLHGWRQGDKKATLFLINHLQPNIGAPGQHTPGGVTVGYLSQILLRIKRKEEFPDGSYSIEGIVRKNRGGYINRNFWIFVLAGAGIHPGLSAFYDASLMTKRVKRLTRRIEVDGVSVGNLRGLVNAAYNGDNAKFDVFHEVIASIQKQPETETDVDDDTVTESEEE